VPSPTSATRLEHLEIFRAGLQESRKATWIMAEVYAVSGLDPLLAELERTLRTIEIEIVKTRASLAH
jgi:hypothetical protein